MIGQTVEKYMTVTWGKHLQFKDSLQFMSSSLDTLTRNLRAAGADKFNHVRHGFPIDSQFKLMLQKGVYPYDYINTFERLHQKDLPTIEQFNSRLLNEECIEVEFARAQQVWNEFHCRTFLEYHNIYLKADVLQLADVFENFRNVCIATYSLDPAHYISAPQLAWDSMLNYTKTVLQLISDPEMFRMLNGGMRGGVAMITKRYAKANNPYLGDRYDSSLPNSYIIYLDANNLYGWAMSQFLPTSEFTWLSENEYITINWLQQLDEQQYGYFIECDLEYEAILHDDHNDFPLAPERLDISANMLSQTQAEIRKCYSMNQNCSTIKLCPNLMNKSKYVCHYRTLKFYINHGMKLKKIHRVIRFVQEAWLKPYILLNQNKRAQSRNEFEKDFYKLMNNSVYGKTLENLLKRILVKLLANANDLRKCTSKPNLKNVRIFDEDLVGVELTKLLVLIDKPFYIGFVVLELAKLHMYKFHYDSIRRKYQNNAELLFTDTDSLMYHIYTEDVYKDMVELNEHMDNSSYTRSSPFFDESNKKVIGKFKDETNGNAIAEFVGLRAKMYSFTVTNGDQLKDISKAKGKFLLILGLIF